MVLLSAALLAAGCTRKFFRERADADACALLTEKNRFEPWKIEQFHVYPDPRARFADPFDPDHPPMPPDDPAAKFLSPNPQKPGKAGVGRYDGTGYLELLAAWDAMNRANTDLLPPPDPAPQADDVRNDVEKDAPGYLITLEQACELGLINARDFQDQRENLYLSALPVSLQRFSFAAQFFTFGDVERLSAGARTGTGRRERWSSSVSQGVNKLFPTGALLLFQFANQLTIEMIGGQADASVSNLTLSLTQPLLQGGGKAVTLEPLTQAERSMLYQIRNYARFRKSFFVSLAGGRGTGGQNDLVGGLGLAAGSVTPTAGYLPTVQRVGRLDIERRNYETLQKLVEVFEDFAEGGRVSQLQVSQVRQNMLNARSSVNNAELQYRNTIDNFKGQLGLPPTIQLEVEQSALRPLTQQLDRYQQVINDYNAVQQEARRAVAKAEPATMRQNVSALLTRSALVTDTAFRERILARWGLWEKRTDKELQNENLALGKQRQVLKNEKLNLQEQLENLKKEQKAVPDAIRERLRIVNERIDSVESEINLAEMERLLRRFDKETGRAAEAIALVLVDARNERFGKLRETWPVPPRICLEGVDLLNAPIEEAYSKSAQYALANRLDLMNERAQMVDSWRQIAIEANSLLGVLDVQYNLNSATPAGGLAPFGFAGSRTSHRLNFNWELPLVRRLERNNYRVALINFQRQRRTLQVTEDNILIGVRSELRELRVLAENYRIQQENVALAYSRFENALETFSAPVAPGAVIIPATQASLTQQLLDAQNTLNRAQSSLYDIWINYLTLRMRLYLDLELLPLDARGVWIDEHATDECPPTVQPRDGGAEPNVRERLPQPAVLPDGEIHWRAATVSAKKGT